MDDLRTTNIMQENNPRVRRNTIVGINNILRNTLAQNFLDLVEQPLQDSQHALKQSEQIILVHYKRIHAIIDKVDEHIIRRLQNHQNQMFSIVKNQIQEMREETRIIIQKLNEAIAKKNTEDQIFHLNNQLDYFKNQTFKLFKQNKKIREENADLHKAMKDNQVQLQNSNKLMQKLKSSCMKQKMLKRKLHQSFKQRIDALGKQENINGDVIDRIFQMPNSKKQLRRIKTQMQQRNQPKVMSKDSSINISLNSSPKDKSVLEIIEDNRELSGQICYPDVTFDKDKKLCEMPEINMKRVESQLMYSQLISSRNSFAKAIKNSQPKNSALNSVKHESKIINKPTLVQGVPTAVIPKGIDKVKNIFFMKTFNQSPKQAEKIESLAQRSQAKNILKSRQIQYMSQAFSKNKIKTADLQPDAVKSKSITK